jgi:hypothetical protein
MRRAVIVLVVVLGLLLIADRVGVVAAQSVVATRIEADQRLSQQPDVSIHGFPFLTQALSGRYGHVTLTLHDLRDRSVRVQTLTVDLRGVHVPLSAVFSHHVSRVPIDKASATILLSFADLNSYFGGRHVAISGGADGEIAVTGSVTVAGRTVSASGTGRIDVRGSDLVVTVGQGLDLTIPLGGLPFRIALVGAKATKAGIEVQATATGLVLHPAS